MISDKILQFDEDLTKLLCIDKEPLNITSRVRDTLTVVVQDLSEFYSQ